MESKGPSGETAWAIFPLTALIPLPASACPRRDAPRWGSHPPTSGPLSAQARRTTRGQSFRGLWAGRRSPSSLFCRLLRPQALKPITGVTAWGARRAWGSAGAPFRVPRRAAGWGRMYALPPGLGSSAGVASSRRGVRSPTRTLSLVWPERGTCSGEFFQSLQEDALTLWPAGAFQNRRHTHFHASAKVTLTRQRSCGEDRLIRGAGGTGRGWGGLGCRQRGSGKPEKNKQSLLRFPSFVFIQLVSRNQLSTASPHQEVCFCLFVWLDHR